MAEILKILEKESKRHIEEDMAQKIYEDNRDIIGDSEVPRFSLYVSGFRVGTTAEDLGKYFEEHYGPVRRVDIYPPSKGTGLQYGFVSFENEEDFEYAFDSACLKKLLCPHALNSRRGLIASKSHKSVQNQSNGNTHLSFYKGEPDNPKDDEDSCSVNSASTLSHSKTIATYKKRQELLIQQKRLLRRKLQKLNEEDDILSQLIALEHRLQGMPDDDISDSESSGRHNVVSSSEEDDTTLQEPLPAPDCPPPGLKEDEAINKKRRRHSSEMKKASLN